MTTPRAAHLETIRSIRAELEGLLEGMDYCLDWKPDSDSWSPREILYHLIDTPKGGVNSVLQGMLSGQLREFEVVADQTNVTSERLSRDLTQVRQEALAVLDGLEAAAQSANEADLTGKKAIAHLRTRGRDEERTPDMLLTGLFARHWRAHLQQLRELRETLGV